MQVLLCLSNILNRNFRNCKPSKCKNKLSFSVNMISQYDTQVKDSDGIYDPVLYLSYSKMKETVSQFPFAISYRPNIRILARNHGILKRVLKFSWIYIMIRLLNCYTETTCFELFIWSSEIQHSDWSSKWFNNLRLWITNINANFIQMKKLFAF